LKHLGKAETDCNKGPSKGERFLQRGKWKKQSTTRGQAGQGVDERVLTWTTAGHPRYIPNTSTAKIWENRGKEVLGKKGGAIESVLDMTVIYCSKKKRETWTGKSWYAKRLGLSREGGVYARGGYGHSMIKR